MMLEIEGFFELLSMDELKANLSMKMVGPRSIR